jgi:tripartite-type tricarboxylate transporter receptor subunit TctC
MQIRFVLAALNTVAALLFSLPTSSVAQTDWPTKPVRAIVPFPPGGATDSLVRAFTVKLSESLGQPFVVDNRGGASGAIGTELAAKAAPDGYTFLFSPSSPLTILPYLRKTPYARDDFVPVARLGTYMAGFAVNNELPVRTLGEYVALARSKPGQVTFGSTGAGSMSHIRLEALKQSAKVNILHVPFAGGAPVLQALLGGQVNTMADSAIFPLVKEGRLRLLAIIADQRHPDFPQVPTVREAGFPEINTPGTFAVFAPAGTPPQIIARLNAEVVKIAALPEVRDKMMVIGFTMGSDSPVELDATIKSEYAIYGKIIEAGNIKMD